MQDDDTATPAGSGSVGRAGGEIAYPGGAGCDRIGGPGVLLLCIALVGDEQVPDGREPPTLVIEGEAVQRQHEPGDRLLHRTRQDRRVDRRGEVVGEVTGNSSENGGSGAGAAWNRAMNERTASMASAASISPAISCMRGSPETVTRPSEVTATVAAGAVQMNE
nr:hypothetical protein [Methanoculleus bourgensis]